MPTPPPEPVKKPSSVDEKLAQEEAVNHINKLCQTLNDYAYSTRSYMPAELDYTEFSNALYKVEKFCNARPDWTLEILRAIEMAPIAEIMES